MVEEHFAGLVAEEELRTEELCEAHPELMPELGEELRKLAAVQRARHQAEDSRTASLANDSVPPPDSFPGYEMVRRVHRGGQGIVYQAVQKWAKRKVAIKVMREGPFAGPHDRARFEREVQILATLTHPNIVTVHDSGVASGHFYFVMDYVAGQPLDVYAAGKERSVREILELFEIIAGAVHAAHLRGVIHRDLKPSNIRMDEHGNPKILDFGLAKLTTGPDSGASQAITATGQFVGSLPWAAPEQVDGGSGAIDVRTDVYALGVILFQMLTARFPYPVVGNMREIMDNIVSAQPLRPSMIRREIDDELDTLILKCLSKEPERRYQSAGELTRDVHRYLVGEPIEAKRDSSWYVFKKTVRRHRLPAVLALLLFVITIGFGAAMAVLYTNARRQASRAERVQRYVAGVFDKLGANEGPDAVSVLDVLDRSAQGALVDLKDEPAVQVEVMEHLARLYGHYGANEERIQWLERALALRRDELNDRDDVIAGLLRRLAVAYDVAGGEHKPELLYQEAIQRYRHHAGGPTDEVVESLIALGQFYHYHGSQPAADGAYRQALATTRAMHAAPHPQVASCLAVYAAYLDNCGRYAEAKDLIDEALTTADQLYAEGDPARAGLLRTAATVVHNMGDPQRAYEMRLEAIELRRRVYGESDYGLLDLGWSLKDLGRYAEAEAAMQRALAFAKKKSRGSATKAEAQYFLATLYADMGEWEKTRNASQASLDAYLEVLPRDHFVVPRPMTQLGKALVKLGHPEEAEPWLREAWQTRQKRKPAGHWKTARTASILGECLVTLGRFEEAEPLLLESYPLIARDRGPNHRRTTEALERIAFLYNRWEKPDQARSWCRKLQASASPLWTPTVPTAARCGPHR